MHSRKQKLSSRRDRLLRLLRDADTSSPTALASWLNGIIREKGMDDEWEAYRKDYASCDPIQRVRGAEFQDYFIVLNHQHRCLRGECQRLQQEVLEFIKEQSEGASGLWFQYFAASDEAVRADLLAKIQNVRAAFHLHKARARAELELTILKRKIELRRGQTPKIRQSPNWCAPMPLFNETEPIGYCQATAKHKKTIIAFLKNKKAVGSLEHKGRGRRMKLYGVETNLCVLDVWLGKWLSGDAAQIAEAYLHTLAWQAAQPGSMTDQRQFRAVLHEHWKRVSEMMPGSQTAADFACYEKAMTDDAAWQQLQKFARRCNKFLERKELAEERDAHRSLPEPLADYSEFVAASAKEMKALGLIS